MIENLISREAEKGTGYFSEKVACPLSPPRSAVISPAALAATLEVGSNDGVKVWLNGKLIHSNNAARALKLGQDKVKINLQAGENPLMVEVVNGATDWETAVRIVGADGKPIAGMKVVAK